MCVANNPTEKHSSFALSPSSHTARQDFKGDHGDVDDNYFHHLPHTHRQSREARDERLLLYSSQKPLSQVEHRHHYHQHLNGDYNRFCSELTSCIFWHFHCKLKMRC